ncbi:agmatine deiminase family protein [Campylobacter sp. 19-13652]|uniref:agmatine deiminase family protein n=1 Tax=Campylobacter sp. 19-13652 TaxID=2840180 RepID=UPI001C84B0E6|nr:agmatine deiminase family protein [Campylobacter sp. 19-13652]
MRAFAEWEEQEALLISLPHKNSDWAEYLDEILASYEELLSAVLPYQHCVAICEDEGVLRQFERFKNIGQGCELLCVPTDDTWIRDYGLIDVSSDNEKGGVLSYDFKFNAWGGKFSSSKDNAVNAYLAKHFGTPVKSVDMVLEGGSVEFNGAGVLLTTTECLLNDNRNSSLNKAQIEEKLKELFGLERVVWLENGFIRGDDTDSHVDTLARFIAPDIVAHAICEDSGDEHFAPLRAMASEIEAAGFKRIELPLPAAKYYGDKRLGCTYTNFIFVNGALIVPTYDDAMDEVVLSRLRKALPNHDIIGVNSLVFVRQNGSLHCSSQNRFKRAKS